MTSPNSFLLFFINKISSALPISQCYTLRSFLYKLCGINLGSGVRLQNIAITGQCEITIGTGTFIGSETLLTGGKARISIGRYCDISTRVTIVTGTHVVDPFGLRIAGKGFSSDIVIQDGVWIGIGSIILPGVT